MKQSIFKSASLLCLLCLLVVACNSKKASPRRPQVKIQAFVKSSHQLEVSIAIPFGHHAYLNTGKTGALIPISFDWKTWLSEGVIQQKPQTLSAPEGIYEELVEAQVFRNQGVFIFQTSPTDALKGKTLRVRSQICNDEIGLCYPPTYQEIEIRQSNG